MRKSPSPVWSEERVNILRERYVLDGPVKLAEILGLSVTAVRVKAGRIGVRPKRETKNYIWTEEMLEAIKKLYPTADRHTLVDAIGLPYYAIQTKARRLGLYNTTRIERSTKTRINNNKSCNIHFFDEWSAPMAFSLGFIFADGSVTKRKTDIVICVVETDRCILDYIKEVTNSVRPFYYLKANRNKANCKPAVEMVLASRILINRVMELGVHPRKTYRDDPFPKIPTEFLPDFIRGFLDGDGSIFVSHQNVCRVGFIGTPKFITGIRNALMIYGKMGFQRVKREKTKSGLEMARIHWSSLKDLRAFSSYIYPPGHGFCLERKRRKLQDWLESKTHIES